MDVNVTLYRFRNGKAISAYGFFTFSLRLDAKINTNLILGWERSLILGKREAKKSYFSFLLRMWQVNGNKEATWRVSLENPHTGKHIGFASLEELFAFLRQKTGAAPPRTTIEVLEQRSIKIERNSDPEQET